MAKTDLRSWSEPELSKVRDHDIRILVENALTPSDQRKAMIQSADESESMDHESRDKRQCWKRTKTGHFNSTSIPIHCRTKPKKRIWPRLSVTTFFLGKTHLSELLTSWQ